jgi:hypothetical protein
MHILQFHWRSIHMNTVERYYIYKEAMHDNHLNDQHTITRNKIFEKISNNVDVWDATSITKHIPNYPHTLSIPLLPTCFPILKLLTYIRLIHSIGIYLPLNTFYNDISVPSTSLH